MQHRPRKRFGQNFLHDPGVVGHILKAVNACPGERIVEIGPGQGAITGGLLRSAGQLDAVELDRDLVGPLQQKFADRGELRIHNTDALTYDFCTLGDAKPLRVVGNLPYNISTPLLFHLLSQAHCIEDMHFLLQKEVVQRMAAAPGSKTYGRLSVMIQVRCRVQVLFDIGPGAFSPPPKVNSAFVRLLPHHESIHGMRDFGLFERLVACAFSQRRKTLRNTLKPLLTVETIRACGVEPGSRAEQLSIADFVLLANACKQDRYPLPL